jgi:competence protein ComEC
MCTPQNLPLATLACLVISVEIALRYEEQNRTRQLIIYQSQMPNLVIQEQNQLFVFLDSIGEKQTQNIERAALSNWIAKGLKQRTLIAKNSENQLFSYYANDEMALWIWQNRRILWLKKEPPNTLPTLQTDLLILSRTATYRPQKLKNIAFRQLILDASVPSYRQGFFSEQAQSQGFTWHSINQSGAYTYKIDQDTNQMQAFSIVP